MGEPTLRCGEPGGFAAVLSPHSNGLTLRVIEPLRCVALRCLPGGAAATQAALADAGIPDWPAPGGFTGRDPWLLWRSPTDTLLIATGDPTAETLLAALRPGQHALACAVDLSPGCVAFELHGPGRLLEALLSRLTDASTIPRDSGRGTRTRLADVSVNVLRHAEDSIWLLCDKSDEHHLERWLQHAAKATALASRGSGTWPHPI